MTARVDELLAMLGRPRRQRRPPPALADLQWTEGSRGRLAYEVQGAGPSVLLVHGWDSSAREFTSLAPEVVAAGFRAVAPDLPGHGASDGDTLDARTASAALVRLAAVEGPFAAVIAHSFGCVATLLALEQGLAAPVVVFFAPPARQSDQLRRLCARNDFTGEETERVIARALAGGAELVDLVARAPARGEPLLVIQSRDDEMTPLAGAEELCAAWPGARLLAVEGLGHNLALRDRVTIAAALRFALGT